MSTVTSACVLNRSTACSDLGEVYFRSLPASLDCEDIEEWRRHSKFEANPDHLSEILNVAKSCGEEPPDSSFEAS